SLLLPSARPRLTRGASRALVGLCANEPSPLPSPFLTPPEFSRCSCAHANVEQLRKDAPRAFLEPPSKTDGFSPSITLRGDFRQELARGKEAYLRAFDAIARFNTSPLVPLKAGELRASFEPGVEQVCVQWNTTVRPVGMQQASPSAEFSFSGLSTYKIDEDGAFSEQFISDLRVNGRRLPSSEFGSWLNLLEQRSATSPVVGLSLLFNTVSGAPAPPVLDLGSQFAGLLSREVGLQLYSGARGLPAKCKAPIHSTGSPRPLGGPSLLVCKLSSLFLKAIILDLSSRKHRTARRLWRVAPAGQAAVCTCASDHLLQFPSCVWHPARVSTVCQLLRHLLSELIRSLSSANGALVSSPLLEHSLCLRIEVGSAVGPWFYADGSAKLSEEGLRMRGKEGGLVEGGLEEGELSLPTEDEATEPLGRGDEEVVSIRWQYELIGAVERVAVFRLEGYSSFELSYDLSGDEGPRYEIKACRAPSRRVWVLLRAALSPLAVQAHTLRALRLNGRPALPKLLLSQLQRAEQSAPELMQFLSSAFLRLSESVLSSRAGSMAPVAPSSQLVAQPQFARGFVRLIQELHAQAPTILTRGARRGVGEN
ncbi:MAG: hypothetical protein SGPRY_003728, partial [Prymnesium sp.]